MISYKPLRVLLAQKDMNKLQLRDLAKISNGTLAKISKDEYLSLEILEKICLALDCRIEDIVEVKKGDT